MLRGVSLTGCATVMTSGRTQPCLVACEDESGEKVDAVAKR